MTPEVKLLLDTVWVTAASALVFFMQAGFALVESGMVRAKNAVNVILKNYCDMCVGGLGFWLLGYGIMFGANPTGWFGTTKFGMNGADPWEYTLMFFQMMFAATAATIVSGALAERIRFHAYLVGSFIITTFVYSLFGSWAWNETGWLKQSGFLDFAGSTVVHTVGATCALAGILALGPRTGRYSRDGKARVIPGHNLPFVALGGLILWLGWFGFNAGSTTAADPLLGKIALNTHLAGCAAATATIVLRACLGGVASLGQIVNGSLGGLVAVTAGCAYVSPGAAVLIGAATAFIIPVGEKILDAFQLDDAVGAIPVHGFCGVWGTVAVGIFKDGKPDLTQTLIQFGGAVTAIMFVFPVAFVMYKIIGAVMPLRVGSIDEQRGLDFAEHGEVGYPEFQEGLLHGGTAAPAERPAVPAAVAERAAYAKSGRN